MCKDFYDMDMDMSLEDKVNKLKELFKPETKKFINDGIVLNVVKYLNETLSQEEIDGLISNNIPLDEDEFLANDELEVVGECPVCGAHKVKEIQPISVVDCLLGGRSEVDHYDVKIYCVSCKILFKE